MIILPHLQKPIILYYTTTSQFSGCSLMTTSFISILQVFNIFILFHNQSNTNATTIGVIINESGTMMKRVIDKSIPKRDSNGIFLVLIIVILSPYSSSF